MIGHASKDHGLSPVGPGLSGAGATYNQDRRKGIILVLAANGLLGLLLLIGLILISQEYTPVFYPRPLTGEMTQMLLVDTLRHPLFWVPFGLLVALWGYAAVDAVRHAQPPAQD